MSPSRTSTLLWWITRVAVPVVALVTVAISLGRSELDRASLEPFFDEARGTFPLRRDWFFENVLHMLGKYVIIAFTAALTLGAAFGWRKPRWSQHARRFAYLVACFATTVGIAGLWKDLADQVTPWDTVGFGGSKPWPELLESDSLWGAIGSPGAHASSGFAWMSLYFVGASLGTRWRWLWLAPGVLLGLLFALGQHARGAHQPSHEPWSVVIAWLVACSFAVIFRRLGWLIWSEASPHPNIALERQPDPALPWLVGVSALLCGTAFFATDHFTEHITHQFPWFHGIFEIVELSGTALGLGIGAWLLTDKITSMRLRAARKLEAERGRRLQMLGRMAASVAHEVRNPLQTVRLIVDEQRHEVPGLRNHALEAEFESCLERIDRAVDLVYRLARPESAEEESADLAAAARESVIALSRTHGDRVEFVWEREPPTAVVASSRTALRIVIDNLLRNAAEASPRDGKVVLNLRPRDDSWTLDIRNAGSLATRRTPSSSEAGLGLGVPISRQIASNAGGGIDIQEGDGLVTCTLRWPRAGEAKP